MNKKYYSRLILVVVILLGILIAVTFLFSYQKVYISLDDGLQALVYKQVSDKDTYSGKAVLTVTHSGSYRLKKGDYALIFRGNQKFASTFQIFSLNGKKLNISIHPDYSAQKISSLLKDEQPSVDSVLNKAYPSQMLSYTAQNATLFNRGDWYAANLVYKGDDQYNADTLRVVLHRAGNGWAIVTKPPDISLSATLYPAVPKEILSKVNRL